MAAQFATLTAVESGHYKERTMGSIAWIVLGLIAGVLAKMIMPGRDPGGIIVTILIGIAGALVGGFVFSLFGGGGVTGVDLRSIIVCVARGLRLLALYRWG